MIAEGIESKASWGLLANWECDEGQGFYLGRPMPADSLAIVLAALDDERITATSPWSWPPLSPISGTGSPSQEK
jgi:predicted signal transduction protein with EAL and GGDEF domain